MVLTKGIEDSNNGLSSPYQYLVNQLAYTGHLLNAEQKQGEKLKLPFLSASEKKKKIEPGQIHWQNVGCEKSM